MCMILRKTTHMKFLLQFLLMALLLLCACGKKFSAREQLIVGMELAYPPFEMTDPSGEPTGVSPDLARALADFLDRELVIRNIPFTGLISSLRTGKVDLVISSMTATEERRKSIDFSEPYLRTGLCMLVGRDTPIESFADADQPGFVIAVNQGTTGHAFAESRLKNAKLRVLDKEQNCVLEVVQGKAQAFIYDQMSVYQNWKKNKDTTRALLNPIREEQWAIGIRKGNDKLLQQVNQFLKDYRLNGGFEDLGETYLAEQKKAFEQLGIPFIF